MKSNHRLFASLFLFLPAVCANAEEKSVNDGTDPTRLATSFLVQYKHTDLQSGDSTGLFELDYARPLGEAKRMSLGVTIPYASGVIDSNYSLGDASVKFTHVVDLNRERGLAYTAEVFFDTADRAELGTGQTVLEVTGIYAKFLQGGNIFAPALVHRLNLSNNADRSDVSTTTLDLYYVPKLASPNFMTYDPAVIADWENEKEYLSLTITFGRLLGKAFGGDSQAYIKPQVLGGGDRPIDWSFQIGYKVLGF